MEATWIGLIDEAAQGNWMFTDGTRWPDVPVSNTGFKCGYITSSGGLYGTNCDEQYEYICMTKGKIIVRNKRNHNKEMVNGVFPKCFH